jgi:tight adherence protein B
MLPDIDPLYLIWLCVALSAALTAEAVYLLCFSTASYRSQINRRLMLSKNSANRESVLQVLRRERGLNEQGGFRSRFLAFNRLVLQSGLTIGLTRLIFVIAVTSIVAFVTTLSLRNSWIEATTAGVLAATALPYLALRVLRARRQKKFGGQFPDALDTIVRSLRAGHPVPVAVAMVGQEMPDPIGSEFGMVSDEVTYGADLETALHSLYCRIGSEDLPLFVTAVGIQSSTGGNLGEILANLSSVIRERFKMRRKIRALAAEGRASAMILSALPIGLFLVIQVTSPEFYASVWHESLTRLLLAGAGGWLLIGNLLMFKMVNFRV